ncbi:Uma2 family endonuclease [Phormidium yuhuli AB48]|uniref:Uma2 family endonuclease n=1 Tax=Phormidium yuhuli AB48 TaxID=2940671 RepID=A0ABY5ALB7_9CYAN|nr:Uma2 family endonuclease [Phormidium yuhuli]USR89795.1 Uma2 family endonuclease [Phormidium yuhuli AB48]
MIWGLDSSKILSLAEFLELPETEPACEYIDGKIYQKEMPQGKGSKLQIELASTINERGKFAKLAYAFPELRVTIGGRSLVPDISVFNWSRIPVDERGEVENQIKIAPDWLIEILSPGQNQTRVMDKIIFCLNQGTELGWCIDPQERLIMVFRGDRLPSVKAESEIVPVLSCFGSWEISVNQVFELLMF